MDSHGGIFTLGMGRCEGLAIQPQGYHCDHVVLDVGCNSGLLIHDLDRCLELFLWDLRIHLVGFVAVTSNNWICAEDCIE